MSGVFWWEFLVLSSQIFHEIKVEEFSFFVLNFNSMLCVCLGCFDWNIG